MPSSSFGRILTISAVQYGHVGEQKQIVSGIIAKQKRNGVCTDEADMGDDLTIVDQRRRYRKHGKYRHQDKRRRLVYESIRGVGEICDKIHDRHSAADENCTGIVILRL